jgi:mannose-6-phosphate isomerase
MAKLDSPFQLSPVFKPKIWGRTDLAPLFAHPGRSGTANPSSLPPSDSELAAQALIGEVWITDDAATFLNGPLAGLPLAEASRKYGPELHGEGWKDHRFPILAKYIFTNDWLSVQVHPDDDYARVHDPGNLGKCEMWYVIRAEGQAEILLALKPGIDKQSLRAAFEKGTSAELLNRFHPKAGEALFVPPGAVHALGAGLVLFEAEENSDLTYRLDDFGRVGLDGKPRPLHWEKGLEVTRVDLPVYRNLPRLVFREPYGSRRYVVASRHFAVEELKVRRLASFQGHEERVEILSLLGGEGRVETARGWLAYRTGDTWLIPPAMGEYRLVPRRTTRLLKIYVPRLDQDFRRPLARRGVGAARIKKLVFD